MYFTMYIDYIEVKYDGLVTPPLLVQAIVISLCPLAIPYKFYTDYPSASKWFLVCWAEVWLRHTYLWIILFTIFYVCLMFQLSHRSLGLWRRGLAVEQLKNTRVITCFQWHGQRHYQDLSRSR
ncbi:hypothetical protein V8C26DRAFT_409928 [Trichoderma gracile]